MLTAQLLPNDDREQERLDFLHHIFRLTFDGDLCHSELDNPQRILDIGTGTGMLTRTTKGLGWVVTCCCSRNLGNGYRR